MGADEKMNVAEGQPLEDPTALGAAFPAGENGDIDAAAPASGATVLKCWRARSSVGAIRAACRPASTTAAAASSATTVFARAHIALQQPQHPLGLGEIGNDLLDGALLRWSE